MGRARSFNDADELLYFFEEYLEECKEKEEFANLAGFARKCYCSKDTLLYYKEENHPFSGAMKLIYTFLENDTINNKMTDNFKKFYMTNTFRNDYKDKQEIVSDNTNTNVNIEPTETEREKLVEKLLQWKDEG